VVLQEVGTTFPHSCEIFGFNGAENNDDNGGVLLVLGSVYVYQ
jgi:hypothetical protein